MKTRNIVILTKHRKSCIAVREVRRKVWNTCWAYLDSVLWLSRSARKTKHNNYNRFWKVRCNDPCCKATLLIREDVILKMLPLGKMKK